MRRPLIAGNWKMNLDRAAAVQLARAVVKAAGEYPKADLALCPPFVYLDAVAAEVRGSSVWLGGQNLYFESQGAFTGETSAGMLLDVGCNCVILGHSERRSLLGETDEVINRKLRATLAADLGGRKLTPIVCVGESLAEREASQTETVIARQFEHSLGGLSADEMTRVVLAYEPVWAIGTGRVATPEQAEEVHSDLRKLLQNRYNAAVAEGVRILYGGSVKPDNAALLLAKPNVDGALVGGASLKAADFLGIAAGA